MESDFLREVLDKATRLILLGGGRMESDELAILLAALQRLSRKTRHFDEEDDCLAQFATWDRLQTWLEQTNPITPKRTRTQGPSGRRRQLGRG